MPGFLSIFCSAQLLLAIDRYVKRLLCDVPIRGAPCKIYIDTRKVFAEVLPPRIALAALCLVRALRPNFALLGNGRLPIRYKVIGTDWKLLQFLNILGGTRLVALVFRIVYSNLKILPDRSGGCRFAAKQC